MNAVKPNIKRSYSLNIHQTQKSNKTNIIKAYEKPKTKIKVIPKRKSFAQTISDFMERVVFPVFVGSALLGSTIGAFLFNTATNQASIEINRVEMQIKEVKNDEHNTKFKINQQGTGIPDKAKELGMIPRKEMIMIQLENKLVDIEQYDSKSAEDAAKQNQH